MPSLYHNEDCTNFFGNHDTTGGRGAAAVDRYVDVIADAGVTTLLCNTNAQLTNYASDVWQPFWQGFDPDGPDDQPFLAGLQAGGSGVPVAGWRRLVTHMLALHQEGVDYPARVAARCRQRGMSPWISLRMNDVHDNANVRHPIHSDFWRQHPELYRRGYPGYFAQAFDFAPASVRAYYDRLIDETLARYDVDGLELDFLREPYLFSRGEEDAGRRIMDAWIADIRARVRACAEQRGHPVRLGVRTPSRPDTAVALGLDPVAWARQGLVDLIVVAPRWATIEFDMPLRQWRERLDGCDVTLAGGLEILVGAHPAAPKRPVTAEEARGAAAQVLHAGADSVYLFNYFQDSRGAPDGWEAERYAATLRSLSSAPEVARHARRHVITFRDVTGPEGVPESAPQLPAEGPSLTLHLPTGPRPEDGTAELTLELEGGDSAALPTVKLNGVACDPLARPAPAAADGPGARGSSDATPATGPLRLTWRVPVEALAGAGPNRIEVTGTDGGPVRVVWVDVRVVPGEA